MKDKIEKILESHNDNLANDYWSTSMGISEHKFDVIAEEIEKLFNSQQRELLLDFTDKINPVLISENCIGINKQEVEDYIDIYL